MWGNGNWVNSEGIAKRRSITDIWKTSKAIKVDMNAEMGGGHPISLVNASFVMFGLWSISSEKRSDDSIGSTLASFSTSPYLEP